MAGLLYGDYAFSINGHPFKAKQMRFDWESLASEDSGRTLDGVMHINWVINKVHKIEIVMPPCQFDDIYQIMSLVQGREYDLSYFDPSDGRVRTIHCYTSNAKSDIYSGVIMNGLYQGFEFHAIEIAGDKYA